MGMADNFSKSYSEHETSCVLSWDCGRAFDCMQKHDNVLVPAACWCEQHAAATTEVERQGDTVARATGLDVLASACYQPPHLTQAMLGLAFALVED